MNKQSAGGEQSTRRSQVAWQGVGALGAAAIVALLLGHANGSDAQAQAVAAPEVVPGQIVVQLRADALGLLSLKSAESFVARLVEDSGSSVDQAQSLVGDPAVSAIKLADATQVGSALSELRKIPWVRFAEPNYVYRAFEASTDANAELAVSDADGVFAERDRPVLAGSPNDASFAFLWGMQNRGQPAKKPANWFMDLFAQRGRVGSDIDVTPLWRRGITGSREMVVAVIDTGVNLTHPDLAANLYTNPGEAGALANNGVDDDGNGFVDDVQGWNFWRKGPNANDDNRHGSHCSGTIGAVGNNGIGLAGVNWKVSILPIKFLSSQGSGSLIDALESIKYATRMKAKVMSNSWGGGGASQAMQAAIEDARDQGILFVAAAGNNASNNDSAPSYPASYDVDNVVSVAATDIKDRLAKFSNFGAKSVDVAAPGVDILSTTLGSKYEYLSGTSMATPHVAGVAALVWSARPDATMAQVRAALLGGTRRVPGLKDKVASGGIIDAQAVLARLP